MCEIHCCLESVRCGGGKCVVSLIDVNLVEELELELELIETKRWHQ